MSTWLLHFFILHHGVRWRPDSIIISSSLFFSGSCGMMPIHIISSPGSSEDAFFKAAWSLSDSHKKRWLCWWGWWWCREDVLATNQCTICSISSSPGLLEISFLESRPAHLTILTIPTLPGCSSASCSDRLLLSHLQSSFSPLIFFSSPFEIRRVPSWFSLSPPAVHSVLLSFPPHLMNSFNWLLLSLLLLIILLLYACRWWSSSS